MRPEYALLIDNRFVAAADGATIPMISPATEEVVAHIPQAGPADWNAALAAASRGLAAWRAVPAWDRARVLHKAAASIRDRADATAATIAHETGKPLAEGKGEILAAADQFEWHAEEARRVYGTTLPPRAADQFQFVSFEPVGAVLALTAWNFPALLPARKIAAALAAGCSVICRPASEAPGACLALAAALVEAGVPPGTVGVLTGDPEPMVPALIAAPEIRKVSFTGSVPVGKRILALCAAGVKKASMELGGHAPVIVREDADPVFAARMAAAAKFRNCGQVCISPSRFYVHESIRPAFAAAFADYATNLRVGDGRDPDSQIGPLIRARALEHAQVLVNDALARGAKLLAGGGRAAGRNKGHFFAPTVLDGVDDSARIMREEPFAPVAPIAGFVDEAEAIARANALPFGLAAYVFGKDGDAARRTAARLDSGMIGINEVLLASAEMPFGGMKESGFGREGGTLGIREYLEPKFVRQKLV
ncbi:MAG: NAD-dependent succinate-semialdehyde dehydrogenase [Rhodospirillales bacterium]|nr:NAD-dependent succinate-semialdehyde dehydrogenase [Rhodospirillales bacterium]